MDGLSTAWTWRWATAVAATAQQRGVGVRALTTVVYPAGGPFKHTGFIILKIDTSREYISHFRT